MNKKNRFNYKFVITISICLIILLLILMVTMMIKHLLDYNEEIKEVDEYSLEQINQIIADKIQINNYNTFFTIEKITNEVFTLISDAAYQNICALMDDEIVYNKSEDEILELLKEYNEILNNTASVNSHYLSYVYEYSDNMYLCKININGRLVNILLRLNTEEKTYKIVFIEKWS